MPLHRLLGISMLVDSILRGERAVGDIVGIGFDVDGFVVGAIDGVDVVGLIVVVGLNVGLKDGWTELVTMEVGGLVVVGE